MADHTRTGDNGGAYQSSLTIRVYPREGAGRDDVRTARLEDLRARLGDELVDRLLRARQLLLNPRPLSEEERGELAQVMDPVLTDVRAAGAIVPEVHYEAWEERPDQVCAFIVPPGLSPQDRHTGGRGVWVARFGPAGERLAELAGQVQEWEVEALAEAGRPATWPECPEHPASHPLAPHAESAERAVWSCPRSHRVVAGIGELGGSGGRTL